MTNILYTKQDLKRKVDLVVNNNKSAISTLLLEVFKLYEYYIASWLKAEDDWAKECVKNQELIDRVYDLEVQLARERHKNEKPVNRCPDVWPDISKMANMSVINEYYGKK